MKNAKFYSRFLFIPNYSEQWIKKKIELLLKGGAEMQRLIEAIITFASRVPDTGFCHAAALRLQAELK